MASQADLAKIGEEAFGILDKYRSPKRGPIAPRTDLAKIGREGFKILDNLGRMGKSPGPTQLRGARGEPGKVYFPF